jgi:hypothetical protein
MVVNWLVDVYDNSSKELISKASIKLLLVVIIRILYKWINQELVATQL